MHGYTEITPFNRGKFIEYIVLLKECPCDQCKDEVAKASTHLNEYNKKAKEGLDLLDKMFQSK